jgi:NADP-dependent 3-hydroxy acid dehydrogenase YdfG
MQQDKIMDNKIVMVAGYVGAILFGVIKSLLQENAIVIVPVKSSLDISVLKKQTAGIESGRLVTILIDFPDEDKASMIANAIIEQYGQLDMVVGFFDHPQVSDCLSRIGKNEWQQAIDEGLTAYFITGKVCIEAMKRKQYGMFLVISNVITSDERCSNSLTNVMAACKTEMTKQFSEDVKNSGVRFYHLLIDDSTRLDVVSRPDNTQTRQALATGDFAIRLFKGQVKHPERLFQRFHGFNYDILSDEN